MRLRLAGRRIPIDSNAAVGSDAFVAAVRTCWRHRDRNPAFGVRGA